MSEKDRNAAIDRVIEALKKKEKEEAKLKAEQEAANQQGGGNENLNTNSPRSPQRNQPQQTGQQAQWYFYNPLAVSQGKAEFQRRWGKRSNEDNWQRQNKTVVAMGGTDMENADSLMTQTDSISGEGGEEQQADSAAQDPHRREYYLAQIPFTPEQVEASNAQIMDGLYNSGVIFKDKLDNLPRSEKALTRLITQYPTFEKMDEAYYHLFLLYSRKGEPAVAQSFVDRLKKDYPKSEWTTLLTDPNFASNARFGVHLEDSLYASTYDAFKADRFAEVSGNVRVSEQRFPLGANRDKFLFIGGLGKLNGGDADGCLKDMNTVVEKYPQSQLAEMAGMIINGVKAGRKLRGGRFDMGDVWQRRSIALNDSDSIQARTFSNERNTNFCFLIVYKPDSVDENKLLFQLAKYNFTNYLVRDFGIEIEDADGLHRMKVGGFRSYDEALQYARELHRQTAVVQLIHQGRTFIISEENLPLLGQQYSYDEYDTFYNKHFAPLKVSTLQLLTEPDEIITQPQQPMQKQIDDLLDDGTFIDNGLEEDNGQQGGTVIPDEEPQQPAQQQDQGTVIPDEKPEVKKAEDSGVTVIPDEKPAPKPQPVVTKQPGKPVTPAKSVTPAKPVATPKATTPAKATPATKKAEPKKKLDEDEIYFGNDAPAKPKTTDKKKETKKKEIDFDDEYYDLDGF